jgi:hypothetical protein
MNQRSIVPYAPWRITMPPITINRRFKRKAGKQLRSFVAEAERNAPTDSSEPCGLHCAQQGTTEHLLNAQRREANAQRREANAQRREAMVPSEPRTPKTEHPSASASNALALQTRDHQAHIRTRQTSYNKLQKSGRNRRLRRVDNGTEQYTATRTLTLTLTEPNTANSHLAQTGYLSESERSIQTCATRSNPFPC